jgi:hypothetical protein
MSIASKTLARTFERRGMLCWKGGVSGPLIEQREEYQSLDSSVYFLCRRKLRPREI